jgi:hypothetical protein
VLDPLCGGERSYVKAEPKFRWYLWWLLTARPYDAYRTNRSFLHLGEMMEQLGTEHEDKHPKASVTEYTRVYLPGHAESIVIEVPPILIGQTSDDIALTLHHRTVAPDTWDQSTVEKKRSPRPFEPLTLLFWLFVVIFGLVVAFTAVGIYVIIPLLTL